MDNLKWKTKNGEKIPVKSLSTLHLMRILRGLEDGKIDFGKYVNLGYTADGDGDGIIYDWVDDPDLVEEWKNILNKELDRREKEEVV